MKKNTYLLLAISVVSLAFAVWLTIQPITKVEPLYRSDEKVAGLCPGSLTPQPDTVIHQWLTTYVTKNGLSSGDKVCNGEIPIATYVAFPGELYVLGGASLGVFCYLQFARHRIAKS